MRQGVYVVAALDCWRPDRYAPIDRASMRPYRRAGINATGGDLGRSGARLCTVVAHLCQVHAAGYRRDIDRRRP